jgi:3',5'-cyclic AMP phosphodiesterase CpdA
LVADAKARGARFLLAAGDISAEAVPTDLADAKSLLDRFGTYRRDYFVARGNHDRAHSGADWASCRSGHWQDDDCFSDAFLPAGEPSYFSTDLLGLHQAAPHR